MNNYILDESGNPKLEDDPIKWAEWFRITNRTIGRSQIGNSKVSTIFLGYDLNFMPIGRPVLWETMIFGGEHDGWQERYTSKEDAIKGHELACQMVKEQHPTGGSDE